MSFSCLKGKDGDGVLSHSSGHRWSDDMVVVGGQAVDHPYLVIYSATALKEAPTFESAAAADDFCGLCHESVEDSVVSICDLTSFRWLTVHSARGSGCRLFHGTELRHYESLRGSVFSRPRSTDGAWCGCVVMCWVGQTTGCNHNFCRACIQGYIDAAQDVTSQCPKCLRPLTVDLTGKVPAAAAAAGGKSSVTGRSYKRSSILNRIDLGSFQTSTKIEAVVRSLSLSAFSFDCGGCCLLWWRGDVCLLDSFVL